jgi:hypothetical protein
VFAVSSGAEHGPERVTGGASRFVVLDLDGAEGRQSLTKLAEEHGPLTDTLTSAPGGCGE